MGEEEEEDFTEGQREKQRVAYEDYYWDEEAFSPAKVTEAMNAEFNREGHRPVAVPGGTEQQDEPTDAAPNSSALDFESDDSGLISGLESEEEWDEGEYA